MRRSVHLRIRTAHGWPVQEPAQDRVLGGRASWAESPANHVHPAPPNHTKHSGLVFSARALQVVAAAGRNADPDGAAAWHTAKAHAVSTTSAADGYIRSLCMEYVTKNALSQSV